MVLLGFFTNLFNGGDIFIIFFLALLFFGAKRLPELARSLGTAINEFNKAKDDVHRQITQAIEPPPSAPVTPPASVPTQVAEPVVQQPAAPPQSPLPPQPPVA